MYKRQDGVSSTKGGEWDTRISMPDYVRNSIQANIDDTYKKFVTKVAENRDMPFNELLSVAGGRIWSGEKAIQLGLVDKIGDLDEAIKSAASFAEIDDYQLITYSKDMDPFDLFIKELIDNFDSKINLSPEVNTIKKIFSSNYKFIDLDKKVSSVVYCFECEYFSTQ